MLGIKLVTICDERSDECNIVSYVERRYNAFAVASLLVQPHLAPRLVKRLVPYGRREALQAQPARVRLDDPSPVLEYHFPLALVDQVHLVDKDEDPGVGGVLLNRFEDAGEVVEVLFGILRFYVEDVD